MLTWISACDCLLLLQPCCKTKSPHDLRTPDDSTQLKGIEKKGASLEGSEKKDAFFGRLTGVRWLGWLDG